MDKIACLLPEIFANFDGHIPVDLQFHRRYNKAQQIRENSRRPLWKGAPAMTFTRMSVNSMSDTRAAASVVGAVCCAMTACANAALILDAMMASIFVALISLIGLIRLPLPPLRQMHA